MLAVLSFLAVLPAVAGEVSPKGHEAVKAKVIDPTPERFTIDVKTIANLWVDGDAPSFALYTSSRVPAQCGDFSTLGLAYKKPTKYTREFNLSKHGEVLIALEKYGCVVIKNQPSPWQQAKVPP